MTEEEKEEHLGMLEFWREADLNDLLNKLEELDREVYKRMLVVALDHIQKELGK